MTLHSFDDQTLPAIPMSVTVHCCNRLLQSTVYWRNKRVFLPPSSSCNTHCSVMGLPTGIIIRQAQHAAVLGLVFLASQLGQQVVIIKVRWGALLQRHLQILHIHTTVRILLTGLRTASMRGAVFREFKQTHLRHRQDDTTATSCCLTSCKH